MIRIQLTRYLKQATDPYKSIALSYSGGTDSNCLLFSLLDLGRRPSLYTYTIKGYLSTDLRRAIRIAEHFKLSHTICQIPIHNNQLLEDIKFLLTEGICGKVKIQCCHGHMYLAKAVKEEVIINGSGVDGIYGVYKDMAIVKNNRARFEEKRQKHLNNPNDDGMLDQKRIYEKQGIKILFPYREKSITDILLNCSYDEMHHPKIKWVILREYQDYYQKFNGLYNPRGSQQIVAGTRQLHEKLLKLPRFKEHKSVVGVYNEMAKEIQAN